MIVAVLLMILAPLIAQLIYFAISRRREYLADASAAVFTRYPEGLASALEKISAASTADRLRGANPANAPMYIVNPLQAAAKGPRAAASATATHPPISERVRILRAMAGGASFAGYDKSYREITGKGGVMPKSALTDKFAGAGLRVQGERWRQEAAAAATTDDPRGRARAVDDFFYQQQGYQRIDCPCGATVKVPPGLLTSQVKCPSCGRQHAVSAVAR